MDRPQRRLEQGAAAGKVVGVGEPIVGAVEGWYVPRYVIEGDPQRKLEAKAPKLRSIADLAQYAEVFRDPKNRARGASIPGRLDLRAGEQRDAEKLRPGGDVHHFRPGTGPALDAAVLSSYRRGEPILYYWSLTPLMGRADLVRLEERPGVDKRIRSRSARRGPFHDQAPSWWRCWRRSTLPAELLNSDLVRMAKDRIDAARLAREFSRSTPRSGTPGSTRTRRRRSKRHSEPTTDESRPCVSRTPDIFHRRLGQRWVDALVTNYGDLFRKISDTLLWAIVNLEGLLRATPWWLLLAIVAAIAWHATRRLLPTLVITGLLFLVGAVGLWDKLMQTLALMLVATFISVLIGIPPGILAAQQPPARGTDAAAGHHADHAQLRVPDPGADAIRPGQGAGDLRHRDLCRAAADPPHRPRHPPGRQRGDGGGQRLRRQPLAAAVRRAVAAGPAEHHGGDQPDHHDGPVDGGDRSMIGARGLGEDVLVGIQTLNVGKGLEAGLAIVILAVVIDRITQAYGRSRHETSK